MTYVTVAQLRDAYTVLNDTTDFPAVTLEALVAEFEGIAADYRGVHFEAVTTVETRRVSDRSGRLRLWNPQVRSISSFVVEGTTIAAASYEADLGAGLITYGGLVPGDEVVITYTHGHGYRVLTDGVTTSSDATVTSATGAFTSADVGLPISGTGIPAGTRIASINSTTSIELTANATASGTSITLSIVDPVLARACREYVRASAVATRSNVSRDVISQSVEGMVTRFSTPDKKAGRPTGYIDVDRLLNTLPDRRRMVA